MSDYVEIVEMGPRDGLQNEARLVPTSDKIAFVDRLSNVGFRRIEVASFVSPKWVPQMADSAEVMAGIARKPSVTYSALTPNMKGLQRAVEAKADAVAIFASASEGFSQANINCSIAESLDRFRPVVEASPVPVRAYLSCITDCPYDGETDPVQAARIAKDLMALGCYELSLGDTLGRATPDRIRAVLTAVLAELPADKLAGHYHDTSGHAVANIEASLDLGLRVFDASTGGLGGCPYAPGAAGNVATEAVAARLTDLGLATGLDQEHLTQAAKLAKGIRHD